MRFLARDMSTGVPGFGDKSVNSDVHSSAVENPDAVLLTIGALRAASSSGGEMVRQSDLPDEFTALVEDVEHVRRETERGLVERINVYVKLQDGRRALITWPKSTWGFVADQLEVFGLGGVAEMVGRRFRFRRVDVGRVRYKRHFPVEMLK